MQWQKKEIAFLGSMISSQKRVFANAYSGNVSSRHISLMLNEAEKGSVMEGSEHSGQKSIGNDTPETNKNIDIGNCKPGSPNITNSAAEGNQTQAVNSDLQKKMEHRVFKGFQSELKHNAARTSFQKLRTEKIWTPKPNTRLENSDENIPSIHRDGGS